MKKNASIKIDIYITDCIHVLTPTDLYASYEFIIVNPAMKIYCFWIICLI